MPKAKLTARLLPNSRWLGVFFAIATTLGGIAVAQPASAAPRSLATPTATLVGFSSVLTINGKTLSTETKSAVTPAATFPSSGYHAFTPQSPSWSFSDSNGAGNEQLTYSSKYQAWNYKLSSAVQKIVSGDVLENADLYHGSTRTNFGEHSEGASYNFHGSSGGITTSGTYANTILILFDCNVGVNCTGSVQAQWNWYMTLV